MLSCVSSCMSGFTPSDRVATIVEIENFLAGNIWSGIPIVSILHVVVTRCISKCSQTKVARLGHKQCTSISETLHALEEQVWTWRTRLLPLTSDHFAGRGAGRGGLCDYQVPGTRGLTAGMDAGMADIIAGRLPGGDFHESTAPICEVEAPAGHRPGWNRLL